MDTMIVPDVDRSDFEALVLERSREIPVLVDFWAPWCGPCRILSPILEKLAAEMEGRLAVVKVNSDENPDLASLFGVQGIPNVLLFKDGKVVDRFVGALPEGQIRTFLRPHCPTEADRLVAEGRELEANGDRDGARKKFVAALALQDHSAAAHLGLARIAMAEGNWTALREQVDAVPLGSDEYEAGRNLLAAEALVRQANEIGDPESCRKRLEEDDADLEARFAAAGHALAVGDHRAALEGYLEVAKGDRSYRDEAPRKAMLVVFNILGARHPMSDEFRDRLSALYY